MIGVDTHKDEHVAVALDELGGHVSAPWTIPATNSGYLQRLERAKNLGRVHTFAVDGCGVYGLGRARFLRRHDRRVTELARPPRRGERRLSGKSDAIDTESCGAPAPHSPSHGHAQNGGGPSRGDSTPEDR